MRRALGSRSRVDAVVESVGATDLRWISGYVSVKEAHSPPLAWHRDWWCWDHPASFRPAPVQVAALCYLGDTDERNGALRIVPGSHRPLRDLPQQVTLGVRAGDAVVIDYRVLHGTHGNATGERRDCVLLSFAPDWRSLPDDIRSHLIQHPALPQPGELASAPNRSLLPKYLGTRRSLALNWVPPAAFAVAG